MGHLVPYKGFEYQIKALKFLTVKKLVIIGSGELENELRQIAVNAGVADRVFILTDIDNKVLKAFCHACSVFCFSSCMPSEAFGIAMLEAMACGCAIVNAEIGSGVNWVARSDKEALTVANRCPESLARAIQKLSDNKAYANKISSAARERATTLMDNSQWRERLLDIFNKLV